VAELAAYHAVIHGRVQGVFFRAFVEQHARELSVMGDVHNLPCGEAVEVNAEGEKPQLQTLLHYLEMGPSKARVDNVEVSWGSYTGHFTNFRIR